MFLHLRYTKEANMHVNVSTSFETVLKISLRKCPLLESQNGYCELGPTNYSVICWYRTRME